MVFLLTELTDDDEQAVLALCGVMALMGLVSSCYAVSHVIRGWRVKAHVHLS